MHVDGLIPAVGDPGERSGAATPSSGGARVELPALGWLFAVAAALVLLARLARVAGGLPTPGWLLGLIVALDLGFMLVGLGLPAAAAHLSLLSPWLVLAALMTAAGACAVWVPVSAWLDGEAPRAFWGLLALGFPLGVLGRVVGVGELLALLAPGPGGVVSDGAYLLSTVAVALIGIAGSLLALAAYARATPGVPVVPGS